MALMRFEPWSLLRQIQNELNNPDLLESYFRGRLQDDNSHVVTSRWRPAVDIFEETDRFVILADLPGVDPKDIEVTMERGVLTIKGERKLEKDTTEQEGYRRVERAYGTFHRRFSLPDSADPDRIQANSRNGVLEIRLPKLQKVQPKKITVQS
jgi:HSP20 family protein